MGKSDIEKIDEQIKSLLEAEKNGNEEDYYDGHVVFVDQLDVDFQDDSEVTKRIEKIDDIEQDVYSEDSLDTNQFDNENTKNEKNNQDEEKDDDLEEIKDEGSLLLIFFLILIIFILCIILFLFF